MFDSIVQPSRFDVARKIAMFLVSTAAHGMAVIILIILPLVFIGALPEVQLLSFLIAAPEPPPAPAPPTPPDPREKTAPPRPVSIGAFEPPPSIPQGITPPDSEPFPDGLPPDILRGIPAAGYLGGFRTDAGTPIAGFTFDAARPAPPPSPPPILRREPVRRSTGIQESKLIKRVDPVYPQIAIHARVSGVVILDVRVDEEGNVESIRVLSGHPLLNEAAVSSVRQWKYSPTILNGEPVPVIATVTVIFTLR
jgi:protein TonB